MKAVNRRKTVSLRNIILSRCWTSISVRSADARRVRHLMYASLQSSNRNFDRVCKKDKWWVQTSTSLLVSCNASSHFSACVCSSQTFDPSSRSPSHNCDLAELFRENFESASL